MVELGIWFLQDAESRGPKAGLRFLTVAPLWSQIVEMHSGCVILSSINWTNKLYFGDNLKILREHVTAESVDLIYLDPPFNSSATYNVLFKEKSGEESAAQITSRPRRPDDQLASRT